MKFSLARRSCLFLSFALALAFVLAAPLQAQAAGKQYERITSQELFRIMESHNCPVSYNEADERDDEDATLSWLIDDKEVIILFYDDNQAIQLYCVYINTDVTVDDVNDWNREHRYSRAYLDEDGDPVLELDLDFAGGISEGRVKDWLDAAMVSVYTWKSEYVGK